MIRLVLSALFTPRAHQVDCQRDKAKRTDAQHHQQTDLNAAHTLFPPRVIRDTPEK
jgi:hypothetical protein